MPGGDDESPSQKSSEKNTIDISSPYFLTPADHPGQNYVGENLLRDGNYGDWLSEMSNALFAKNKIGFVDGTILMPKEGSPDLMNWRRCNAMVRGWLTSSMEKEIKNSVKYAASARDMWVDLQERFGKENAPRAYELRRSVTMIRQENLSISAYYTKLRGVWDEIQSVSPTPTCTCRGCRCGISKEIEGLLEKERLYDFLMGLNDEYGAVKTQILSSKPLLTLGAAYHLVSQDEQQRQIGAARRMAPETAAFQVSRNHHSRPTIKPYSHTSDMREDCGGSGDKRSVKDDNRVCTRCHKSGHTIDGCFDIIGYPDWWIEKYGKTKSGKTKTQPCAAATTSDPTIHSFTKEEHAQLLQIIKAMGKTIQVPKSPVANMTGKIDSHNSWVIDSGASEHITYDETLLETTKKIDGVLRRIHQFENFGTHDRFCDSCTRAKQHRLPFPISFSKTENCFELIHIDIWGRYHTASFEGAQYFLSIVDDYSRGVWVYLMQNKTEVSKFLIMFCNMVETQFNKSVKRIRTDNGLEFQSSYMLIFYKERGILLETSCPYTPQQNGVVERKHRHLLEIARALRFQAALPIEFWGECVLTAAYIINKLPSHVLENKTPHEILLTKNSFV